jgi:hypothetical protein
MIGEKDIILEGGLVVRELIRKEAYTINIKGRNIPVYVRIK